MHLLAHSCFSLKYGVMTVTDLVKRAKELGHESLCLTDINNTSCSHAFIKACKGQGIKPILGIEFRTGRTREVPIEEEELYSTVNQRITHKAVSDAGVEYQRYLFTAIAKNSKGWEEICEYMSKCSLENKPISHLAPKFSDVYVIYRRLPRGVEIHELRPWEYIGIRTNEVNNLYSSYLKDYQHKLVIYAPATFAKKRDYSTHKLLRCIDLNILLSRLDMKHCASKEDFISSSDDVAQAFVLYPQIVENTRQILAECHIEMEEGLQVNRLSFTGSEADDFALLSKLALQAIPSRYGHDRRRALERTRSELKVIREMGFCAYFLITWDIVRYAHSVGFYHVGRGSGANSIVAYALEITDVDPLDLDLYFERFINPHRSSPPDFDIDFSWDERDMVIEYVFKRYGRRHTALLAAYNTFKGKSIIRELGKVFGLTKEEIDTIVFNPLKSELHHPYAQYIFDYGKLIEGFPNYLSIHAGGILISEKPIFRHTALQMMPKGFPITHFDMYGAEDMGYHKFDVLSQRGLGHIKDTVEIVKRNQGRSVDVRNVQVIKQDEKVRQQLRSARCMGCFYIESPAMRGLISKLRCDNYVHLVAASSIIRPGVAKSGMMREYIERFHSPERTQYLHTTFEEHLQETFGIMVYQEDVMKIVHHFAGLDLGESDVLRRMMSGKKKSSDKFEVLQKKYLENCKERGYSDKLIQEVWRQIESFSGYSFCKAHSASFAVESFQSLYLKTYFPIEFMTAVINNFGGFYRSEYYFHEARMCGADVQAPCVNHSHYLNHVEGKTIYVGMVHLLNLDRKVADQIVQERNNYGKFHSFEDFCSRIRISQEHIDILIRINAFRYTGVDKCSLMWQKNSFNLQETKVHTLQLFQSEYTEFEMPTLEIGKYDQAYDEIELLGFSLCSPFELVDLQPVEHILVADMEVHKGRQVTMIGYYVTRKYVHTIRNEHMNFGTWIDEKGDFFDSVHFPKQLTSYPFRGRGCYLMRGKIAVDHKYYSLEVSYMEKLPYIKDQRY